jgi:hypothetical protein
MKPETVEAQLARYKRGEFTDEEFQELCHNLHTKRPCGPTDFCNGCEDYQIKLFGRSPITELRDHVAYLKRQIQTAISEHDFVPLGEALTKEPGPALERLRGWRVQRSYLNDGYSVIYLVDDKETVRAIWPGNSPQERETADLLATAMRDYTDLCQAIGYNRHLARELGKRIYEQENN